MNNIHVIPLGDIVAHEESEDCICLPKVEHEGDAKIIVHNSFDGREEKEHLLEIARWN